MIVPVVTVFSVDSLGQTNSVTLTGTATVGGPGVSGTAWLEYGTDPVLNTFVKSPSWSFTGDISPSSVSIGTTPSPFKVVVTNDGSFVRTTASSWQTSNIGFRILDTHRRTLAVQDALER
jgi:hypothetical protein